MIPIIEIPLNIEHWDFYVLPTYIINENNALLISQKLINNFSKKEVVIN